jgi:hypothetical protein
MDEPTRPNQIKAKVRTLAARRKNDFWDLGGALLLLRDNPETKALFRLTVTEAGLSVRLAYYFCEVAEHFRPVARYRARIESLGWTKAQAIAKGVTPGNIKKRLELAEVVGRTVRELQVLMKPPDASIKGRNPQRATRYVQLHFTEQDFKRFEKAVLRWGGSRSGGGLAGKEKAVIALIKAAAQTKTPP